jgi:N-acetylmuramoyl-L-alanine amidase
MERKKALTLFNHTKGGNIPKYIVIHYTGTLTSDSDEGNAKYFASDGRKASAHYFVDKDSCTQVVLDSDKAWHVGKPKGVITNSNSIGIEMCGDNGEVITQTETNTLELVKELMKKYNIPSKNVVRHFDASGKNCPSAFNKDNKWTRWFAFKSKLEPTVTKLPSTVLKKGSKGDGVKLLQESLTKKGFPVKIDGDFGLQTENVVKLFQNKNGLISDGIVGNKTWEKLV